LDGEFSVAPGSAVSGIGADERCVMQDKTWPLALIVEDEALLALAVEDLLTKRASIPCAP
jgi:hypothetical protein